jgi:hypothetical protein
VRGGLAGALAVGALAGAGCGSSASTGSGGDPTSVIPASAPLYVSATVRPDGSLRDDTVSVARKLTHQQDPFGRLVATLSRSSTAKFNYARDIRPWLGGRVAAFFTSVGSSAVHLRPAAGSHFGSGTEGAIVAATTDAGKARAYLQRHARSSGAHSASYRGVSYEIGSDGTAEGMVGGFVVAGSDSGFKSVVDTAQGGAALAKAQDFLAVREPAGNVLAQAYINFSGLLGSLHGSSSSARGLLVVRQLLASAHMTSADIALTVPSSGSVAVDVRSPASAASPPTPAKPSGADVLAGLPGDSWFALGIGDLSASLTRTLKGLTNLGSLGGVSLGGLFSKLKAPAGLNVQRDLLSWIGGTGVFVRGGSLLDIGVAVVIDSKAPARSRAAVAKLGSLLRRGGEQVRPLSLAGTDAGIAVRGKSSPLTFDIVDGQGKFVIGLGDAAVTAALHPATRLAGAPSYAAAQAALGGGIRPSLMLDFPSLLNLVGGIGAGSSSSFAAVKPYLQSLGTLAAGGQTAGSLHRSRVVLTVH